MIQQRISLTNHRPFLPTALALTLLLAARTIASPPEGLRFDNRSAIFEVPAQPALDLTQEVSLEAWLQADPMPGGGGRILDKSRPGTQLGYMLDTWPGNSLRFLNAKGMCRFDAQLPADKWSHVVAVYSVPKRIMKLFLNGKEVASLDGGEFPEMNVSLDPLRVGCDPDGGNRFLGRILRAAIYSRALAPEEIKQRAADPQTPALPGVLGEWNLPATPGRTIRVSAGGLSLTRPLESAVGFQGEFHGDAPPPREPLSLWYRRPATEWVQALAIGNGRLGGMVFGGVDRERIQLNEDTLWAGGPYEPNNPEALAALPEARRLIFEGKYREADRLVNQKMIARPRGQMPYQTVGDLFLEFSDLDSVSNYRRELNLDTGIASVTYTVEGVTYTRECFASPIDQVVVVRLSADKPGRISFRAGLKTPQKAALQVKGTDTLVLDGVNGAADGIAAALKFQARVQVLATGGRSGAEKNRVTVSQADSATLLVAAATSYRSFDDVSGDPAAIVSSQLQKAAAKSYERLRLDHIAEHQRLFRRVSLDLGPSDSGRLPTDERIRNFPQSNDPQLAALYYQFGRYLLISSSRPGGQTANLQGLWNESMNPPWGGKYTININTEMNYWPVETANLGECIEPLVTMVQDLSRTGAETARKHWGAGGWVAHHNTDLWRAAAPIDGPWGHWPTGGAWLCQNLWEHFLFTSDQAYLARIYPAMKGAAQFFLDSLVEELAHKWLVTCPSASPENAHPKGTSICAGPTMDMQIIRDLFSNCIRAGEILNRDADFRGRLEAARQRLAPNQIGQVGQLQEWLEDWDLQAGEIYHRHVSHLYGLYPSAQISLRGTPELAAAARKSLEIRGDDATGWGLGWRLNLWARLQDAEHAYQILRLLLRPDRTYPNLFDAHPPFQIDGNFGGTAGIGEMLLQSHAGEIELLPALPKAWPNGSVKGLRARGGCEIDLAWKDGRLVHATIRASQAGTSRLRYAGKAKEFSLGAGAAFVFDPNWK